MHKRIISDLTFAGYSPILRSYRTISPVSNVLRPSRSAYRYPQDVAASYSTEVESPKDSRPLRTSDASLASVALDLPLLPGQRKPRGHQITVNDLYATIAAHREANLGKLFSKYETQGLLDHPLAKRRAALFKSPTEDVYPNENRRQAEFPRPGSRKPCSIRIRKIATASQTKDPSMHKAKFVTPYERLCLLDCAYSSQERLNNEIRAFEEYFRPTRSEMRSVEHCIQEVRQIASRVLPGKRLVIQGSRETGLAGPLSDVDFNIEDQSPSDVSEAESRLPNRRFIKDGNQALTSLQKALRRDKSFAIRNLIKTKRLMVLNGVHKRSGLEIQIVARPKEYGDEFCKYYQAEYPQLRPLHILLSQFLKNTGLNTRDGSVGSYGLYIMILVALTNAQVHIETEELGRQLLHVLGFWARADLLNDGYAADPPCTFSKYECSSTSKKYDHESAANQDGASCLDPDACEQSEVLEASEANSEPQATDGPSEAGIRFLIKYNRQQLKGGTRQYKLCLQDPANPFNDVGRGTSKARDIQGHFQKALDSINLAAQIWDKQTLKERSDPKHPMILLRGLLNTSWRSFCEARGKLQSASPSWI